MGKPLSIKQAATLISVLMTNVNWEEVPAADAQTIIDAARRTGPLFAEFIKNAATTLRETAGTTPSILELVSTIVVNATTSKFIARERFVINTKDDAPVKISYLGDNFKAWFLNDGKTEDPMSVRTLCYHKLRQSSVDGSIITELGGEAKAETSLSEMFAFLEKQKHGEDGVLLNNGYANIFYTKDSAGVLRSVYARWYDDGWRVSADSVEGPGRWHDGYQVFSRNSVAPSAVGTPVDMPPFYATKHP